MKTFSVTVLNPEGSIVTNFENVCEVNPCQLNGTLYFEIIGETAEYKYLRGIVPGNLLIKTDAK